MRPFLKAGGLTYQVRLYDAAKRPRDRSAGTRELATAEAIARTVAKCAERAKLHPLYAAMADGRLAPFDVWRADEADALDGLLARLADVDVEPLVAAWARALTTAGDGGEKRRRLVAPRTAAEYERMVRLYVPGVAPCWTSGLTADALEAWLDGMEDVEPNTIRNRGVALSRFFAWLVRRKVLDANPMREVELPPPGKPRTHYLDTPEAVALVEAMPAAYLPFVAFVNGTGCDVSAALRVTPRDVERGAREVRAPGTKTHNRDRLVRVADWAWDYLAPALRGKLPHARLFDGVPSRLMAARTHAAARDRLAERNPVYTGYTLRDARHTWAVRAIRSGWPLHAVAEQLGHVDGTLVLKVYGRFQPRSAERDRWEALATARDAALAAERAG